MTMTITNISYTNYDETFVLVEYVSDPDLKTSTTNPIVVEWVGLGNTITPFLDVPGRLDDAKLIASNRLMTAYHSAIDSTSASVSGNTFNINQRNFNFLLASVNATPPQTITMLDNTMTPRSLTNANQDSLVEDYRDNLQTLSSDFESDYDLIQNSGSVAAIDAVLTSSAFGNLGNVYS